MTREQLEQEIRDYEFDMGDYCGEHYLMMLQAELEKLLKEEAE